MAAVPGDKDKGASRPRLSLCRISLSLVALMRENLSSVQHLDLSKVLWWSAFVDRVILIGNLDEEIIL